MHKKPHEQDQIQRWEKALEDRPNDYLMHFKLGQAFNEAGNIQRAIAHHKQAIDLVENLNETVRKYPSPTCMDEKLSLAQIYIDAAEDKDAILTVSPLIAKLDEFEKQNNRISDTRPLMAFYLYATALSNIQIHDEHLDDIIKYAEKALNDDGYYAKNLPEKEHNDMQSILEDAKTKKAYGNTGISFN